MIKISLNAHDLRNLISDYEYRIMELENKIKSLESSISDDLDDMASKLSNIDKENYFTGNGTDNI